MTPDDATMCLIFHREILFLQKYDLMGIASFGMPCDRRNHDATFTEIAL